ncbi:MAG TPA: hypothetical protein VFV46_06805 [Lacibacter sp.]|nr:hypothetical protein [Lacibacter sp.]
MKKMIVLVAAVMITGATFANPVANPVSEKAKAAFAKEFKGAQYTEWKGEKDGLYLVTFKMNGESLTAWLSEDGKVEALQRNITADKATILASRAISTLSSQATVTALVEVTQNGDLYYLVKTEDEKSITTYKVYADGETQKIERRKL